MAYEIIYRDGGSVTETFKRDTLDQCFYLIRVHLDEPLADHAKRVIAEGEQLIIDDCETVEVREV